MEFEAGFNFNEESRHQQQSCQQPPSTINKDGGHIRTPRPYKRLPRFTLC